MKYLLFLFVLTVGQTVTAQNYSAVDAAGAVQFVISNLGFDVDGNFKGVQGRIAFDENNLAAATFDVLVDANSINTDNNTRDKHLRGKDYFDVAAFPQIKMSSTKVAKSATAGYFVLFAKLTIKGITKEISFPFKTISDNGGLRFIGSFKIKRRDFGVGGRSTVSNDVDIKLNVFAKKL
jgi:polyisoprenoid-binding protein YceI